ncbi:MAG: diguanylate cyclase, partial [Anaerolineae bacterium]|nr:diguanylate cyclase [Anaerolineae bacterium]
MSESQVSFDRLVEMERKISAVQSIPEKVALCTHLARLAFQAGELQRAENACEQVFELSQALGPDGNTYLDLTGGALVIWGKILLDSGEPLQAKSVFKQALTYLGEDQPDFYLVTCVLGLTWIELRASNLPEARVLLDKAIRMVDELPDEPLVRMQCYSYQAYMMEETGFFDKALEFYRAANAIAVSERESLSEVKILNNQVLTMLAYGHAEEALLLLPELEKLGSQVSDLYRQYFEDTIGQVYLALNDYPRAIQFFKRVVDASIASGKPNLGVESSINLSKALCQVGEYEQAILYAQAGLEILEDMGEVFLLCDTHGLLASIYEQTGDYRRALMHHKQHHALGETKYSRETLQKISDLTASFQAEASRKDAEILRLKNLALVQELEQHQRGSKELEKLASTDPLTGLLNRRSLFTLMGQLLTVAEKEPVRKFSIAILDLDHFKQINDQHGHLVGDQALVEFA